MRTGGTLFLGLALLPLAAASPARADDADVCMSSPVEGQKLQKVGKLLAARDKFASCARKTCPGEIVQDCTRWVGEVEAAIPSVVLAARDQTGKDLADVTLSIDGGPTGSIGARSVSLDPGSHRFVFRRGPGAAPSPASGEAGTGVVEQVTILREGEKNREVVATFRTPGAPTKVAMVEERPVPAAAWVSGAFGIAGLGVLAVAGSMGIANRSADHCDTGCTQSQKNGVDTLFRVADVGLGVGVVGVVLSTILILARPTVEHPAPAAGALLVDVRGLPGGGAATIGGRF